METNDKTTSLSSEFIAQNHGRWFPMPRWWHEELRNSWLTGFLRLFAAIWVETIALPKSKTGRTSYEASIRDLARAAAMDGNDVSRFLAAASACELLRYEPARGAVKSKLTVRTKYFFDEGYMRDFCWALHSTIGDEKCSQTEMRTERRARNEDFVARVRQHFQAERTKRAASAKADGASA
jgi:hypothetical protein